MLGPLIKLVSVSFVVAIILAIVAGAGSRAIEIATAIAGIWLVAISVARPARLMATVIARGGAGAASRGTGAAGGGAGAAGGGAGAASGGASIASFGAGAASGRT